MREQSDGGATYGLVYTRQVLADISSVQLDLIKIAADNGGAKPFSMPLRPGTSSYDHARLLARSWHKKDQEAIRYCLELMVRLLAALEMDRKEFSNGK